MVVVLSYLITGDLKDGQVKDIMGRYEKDLEASMNKHNIDKDRQADDLRRRLAERRKKKEQLLHEKHKQEVSFFLYLLFKNWVKFLFSINDA